MKLSIKPATPSTSRAGRFTTAQVLSMLDSDDENELLNGVDYPSDEIASSSRVRVSAVGPSIAQYKRAEFYQFSPRSLGPGDI